jgi:hypothetical protein
MYSWMEVLNISNCHLKLKNLSARWTFQVSQSYCMRFMFMLSVFFVVLHRLSNAIITSERFGKCTLYHPYQSPFHNQIHQNARKECWTDWSNPRLSLSLDAWERSSLRVEYFHQRSPSLGAPADPTRTLPNETRNPNSPCSKHEFVLACQDQVNVTNHTNHLLDVLLEVNTRFADSRFHSVNARMLPRSTRSQELREDHPVKCFEEIEVSGSLFFDAFF